MLASSTLFMLASTMFMLTSLTLFMLERCSSLLTLFVEQHCSAMITVLLRHCSTNNAGTTCAIFSCVEVPLYSDSRPTRIPFTSNSSDNLHLDPESGIKNIRILRIRWIWILWALSIKETTGNWLYCTYCILDANFMIKGLITWAGLARLVGLTRVTNIFSRPQKTIWINLRILLYLN